MSISKPSYKRGDIVLFRHDIPIDDFTVQRGPLLVGIIRSFEPESHVTTSQDQITSQWWYPMHVAGTCIPSETYSDHVTQIISRSQSQSQGQSHRQMSPEHNCNLEWKLPMPLKTREREMFAERLEDMKTNVQRCGHHFESGSDIYTQISDLKYIVLAARNIHVKCTSPYASTQMNVTEERMMRPSFFYDRVRTMMIMFATKRSCALKRLWFCKFQQRIQEINHQRHMASVIIQKYWRCYLQRDTIDVRRKRRDWMKVHNRFLSFYVPQKDVSAYSSTLTCYNVKGPSNVFLTTHAMADEWALVMRSHVEKVAVIAQVSTVTRMDEALKRWKRAIVRQKLELKHMYDEEIYCVI